MGMNQTDIERLAEAAFAEAGMDDSEPCSPIELAHGILGGATPVVRARRRLLAPAVLARVGQDWRIYLRQGLSARATDWLISHELGELMLIRMGYRGPGAEQLADRIGGALRAPRRAFAQVAQAVGRDWRALARVFETSESAAALRWSEITSEPLALLAPKKPMRTRGAAYPWPKDLRSVPRGCERVPLTDARGRSVLVATG